MGIWPAAKVPSDAALVFVNYKAADGRNAIFLSSIAEIFVPGAGKLLVAFS